jgi:hypothetical protein
MVNRRWPVRATPGRFYFNCLISLLRGFPTGNTRQHRNVSGNFKDRAYVKTSQFVPDSFNSHFSLISLVSYNSDMKLRI